MHKTLRYFFLLLSFIILSACGVKKMMEERPEIPMAYRTQPIDTIAALDSLNTSDSLAVALSLTENTSFEIPDTTRVQLNDSFYRVGKNQLRKNQFGIWEMYLEGDAYSRGLAGGKLMKELMAHQEDAFMNQVLSMVPSEKRLKFILKFVNLFNRNIQDHITEEYKQEILGISKSSPKTYDTLVPAYIRNLYLHGAHDIGHALDNLLDVGCTSFAVWGDKSFDGQLLLGRNFDFHVNDAFNRDKIVAFINPDKGHKFMMYTWPGFMGVVSGINEHGITVTINAGKSKIPFSAKTPISLLAREILQYSKNLYDAERISKSREVFVSESIMVGSQIDKTAIIIEVGPGNHGIYKVPYSAETIVSTNHFQSDAYADDKRNLEAMFDSHSMHRFERMHELIAAEKKVTVKKAIKLLREKRGFQDSLLGYGNERAINQLQAHHGIVFKPQEYKAWVSAPPYNMGKYIGYDVKNAFQRFTDTIPVDSTVAILEDVIAQDPFVTSEAYKDYLDYKELYADIKAEIAAKQPVPNALLQRLILLNPHQWKAYALLGDYFYMAESYEESVEKYQAALDLRVTSPEEYRELLEKIEKGLKKLNRWQN